MRIALTSTVDSPVRAVGSGIILSVLVFTYLYKLQGFSRSVFLIDAVLAFPASAGQKAIATAIGILLIQAMNLIRVVTLYIVGCHKPEWFASFHLAIWQTIVFATAVVFFAAWSRRAVASA